MSAHVLRGSTLVLTGASAGIGRAVALDAATDGMRIVLVGRDEGRLAEVAAEVKSRGGEGVPLVADLAEDTGVDKVVEALGGAPVAALVHSAGAVRLGKVADAPIEDLDLQYRINLRAPYLLTQRLLPSILEAKGQVVFINSGAGQNAKSDWSGYAASKHGLRALADSLRAEVAPAGVRVTTVYPGRTASDMQASVREQEGKPYDPSIYVRASDIAAAVMCALRMAPPAALEEVSVRPMP